MDDTPPGAQRLQDVSIFRSIIVSLSLRRRT